MENENIKHKIIGVKHYDEMDESQKQNVEQSISECDLVSIYNEREQKKQEGKGLQR